MRSSGGNGKFKKMYLVGEEEARRRREEDIKNYDPHLRALEEFDRESNRALTMRGLTPEERVRLLIESKSRYHDLLSDYKRGATGTEAPPPAPPPPPPPASLASPDLDPHPATPARSVPSSSSSVSVKKAEEGVRSPLDQVASEIGENKRVNFVNIRKLIESNPHRIAILPSGEVKVEGQLIHGSNIRDLIPHVLNTNRGKVHPIGYKNFSKILKILQDIIKNEKKEKKDEPDRSRPLTRSVSRDRVPKQSGTGLFPPPGKRARIRILRL